MTQFSVKKTLLFILVLLAVGTFQILAISLYMYLYTSVAQLFYLYISDDLI